MLYLMNWYALWYVMLWYGMWTTCSGLLCDCYDIWYDICTIWIILFESMKTLWYDRYVTWMIWYDWHAKLQTSMKYNPDIRMRSMRNVMRNGMKTIWYERDTNGVVLMIIKVEKCWDLMHYCVLMHRGIPLFLHDRTNVYTTRQGNVYYVCHNPVVTVTTPNVSDINSYQRILARPESGPGGVQTDWCVHTRTCGPCVGKLSTHSSCSLRKPP